MGANGAHHSQNERCDLYDSLLSKLSARIRLGLTRSCSAMQLQSDQCVKGEAQYVRNISVLVSIVRLG